MTNEEIRTLCKIAYEYAEEDYPFEEFLDNEGEKVKPRDQLTLGLIEQDREFKTLYKTIIENFDDVYDHNIVDEIIGKVKLFDNLKVKTIEIFCSKSFINRFNEVFSYANHGSKYNYNSFGSNTMGREILTHRGIKLEFKWLKK